MASASLPSLVSNIRPLSPACIVLTINHREPRSDGNDSITDFSATAPSSPWSSGVIGWPCGL
jgi:hypothetical protein